MQTPCKLYLLVLTVLLFGISGSSIADSIIFTDNPTGIYGLGSHIISFRYMRHVWVTQNKVIGTIAQKGKYNEDGITLYRSVNGGRDWSLIAVLEENDKCVADGVRAPNDDLLIVTSSSEGGPITGIDYIRLHYDRASSTWYPGPAVRIISSSDEQYFSRASIAIDGNYVMWCVFRYYDVQNARYQLQVYFSFDEGASWQDSGVRFGTSNDLPFKAGKLIAVDSKMVLLYHNSAYGEDALPVGVKQWAFRKDSDGLHDLWTTGYIALMNEHQIEGFGQDVHWSVASDYVGNLHLSYQDHGIWYCSYDALLRKWSNPIQLSQEGSYSNISVTSDNDVYLFRNVPNRGIVAARKLYWSSYWSQWRWITSPNLSGRNRMASPSNCGWRIPVIFMVNSDSPYELWSLLIQSD